MNTDLFDSYVAHGTTAAEILKLSPAELIAQVSELQDEWDSHSDGDPEEVAEQIARTANALEYSAWLVAGSPIPLGYDDESDGISRPDFWLMDWRNFESRLTTTETAAILGISSRRVLALIKAGQLPARKYGRDWIIEAAALDAVRVRQPGRPKTT